MTSIGNGRSPVAYCKLHKNTLTKRQMKGRKCLSKGCYHLSKYAYHPYWHEREVIKQKKKAKI